MSTPTDLIVVHYPVTKAEIAAKKLEYAALTADTPEGYDLVRKAIGTVVKTRTAIEARRVELKADALSYGKRIDAEAKELTALVVDVESDLRRKKEAVDAVAREKQRLIDEEIRLKREAEEQRIADEKAEAERLVREAKEAEDRRIAEEQRIENERLAAERKKLEEEQAAFRQRAENEAAAQQKKLTEERAAFSKKLTDEAEAQRKQLAAESEEQRKQLAEADRLAAERRAALKLEEDRLAAIRKADEDRAEALRISQEAAKNAQLQHERMVAHAEEVRIAELERAERLKKLLPIGEQIRLYRLAVCAVARPTIADEQIDSLLCAIVGDCFHRLALLATNLEHGE